MPVLFINGVFKNGIHIFMDSVFFVIKIAIRIFFFIFYARYEIFNRFILKYELLSGENIRNAKKPVCRCF